MKEIEQITDKALRGEPISNGEIIIAVNSVFKQAVKTNGRVTDLEDFRDKTTKEIDGITQALGAITNARIAEAARKQGLMVIPTIAVKIATVLGVPGIAALITLTGAMWHLSAVSSQTKEAVDSHTSSEQHIISLLNKNDAHNTKEDDQQESSSNAVPR